MFTAYFDASGTRRNESMTMAGYVSDAKKWARFEAQWNAILNREKVGCFHMTDFASKQKEYRHWESDRRGRFLADLVECAWKYTNKAFSATVVLADYHAVDREYCLHECLGQPYSVVGRSCVGHVKEWARKHNVKQVAFVFETGDEDRGDFERICREEDKIEPAFHGKKDFVPLQAADLIAWKSRHPIREALRDDNDFSVEEAERILASIGKLTAKPYKGGAFDMRSFQKICEQGKIPLRKDRI